jgi:hypothetical protein
MSPTSAVEAEREPNFLGRWGDRYERDDAATR